MSAHSKRSASAPGLLGSSATLALVAACALASGLGALAPGGAASLGLTPSAPSALGLLAHPFVHASAAALLWNLLWLGAAGPRLEASLGRSLFAGLFAASALAGAAAFVALNGGLAQPLLGAAAGVAGLGGALFARPQDLAPPDPAELFVREPASRVRGLVAAAAAAHALVCVAVGDPSRFALSASAVGFAFGALAALALRRAGLIAPSRTLAPGLAEAARAWRSGDAAGARDLLRAELDAGAEDALTVELYARTLAGKGGAGSDPLGELLASALQDGRRELALALWRAGAPLPEGAARTLFGWLREAGAHGEARLALQTLLQQADPAASAKLARELRRGDPLGALRASERALASGELSEVERRALEDIAAGARKEAEANGVVVLDAAVEARATQIRARVAPRQRPEAAPEEAAAPAQAPPPAPDEPWGASALDLSDEPEATAAAEVHEAPDSGALFDRDARDLGQEEPARLPDPAVAGEAALLDALHAALSEDGVDLAEADDAEKPAPEPEPPLRTLELLEAKPVRLDDDAIVLETAGRGRGRILWSKIDAVAAAGVSGLSKSGKAVLIVDLVTGFLDREARLRVVRLRADQFDPRGLVAGQSSPLAALRTLVAELRARTRAIALPEETRPNAPFRIFPDLASYQGEVLGAQSRAAATSAP